MMIVASTFVAPCAYADLIAQTPPEKTTALKLDGSWSEEMDHRLLINSDDWYSFHIDKQGKLNLKMKTDDALEVRIYKTTDMKNEVVAYILKDFTEASKTESKNIMLLAGDYYVKAVSKGKYSLCATFGGNSYVNPQQLTLGNAASGLAAGDDDPYWYQFNITSGNKYRVSIMSYGSVQLEIYTPDRATKLDTLYVWGDGSAPLTTIKDIDFSAGSYIIKVVSSSEYALAVTPFSPDICSHIYTVQYVPSTYFDNGYTLHTCTICGYSYKGEVQGKKTLKTPKFYTLKSGKKKITVSNSQINAVTGYQIKVSTSKKFTKKTTKTLNFKKSKYTVKKLKANKKYYVKVRAYKTQGGKTVYSSWSKVKTVKTK